MIAYAEMWTYCPAQHGEKRPGRRVGTAVVTDPDGRRWADFAVGDRNENTLQLRYARLPEAGLYRTDADSVYGNWLPPGNHVVGKDGAVH